MFTLLVLVGVGYLASLAYFSKHDINYLDAGKMKRAQDMAKNMRLTLPATLEFGSRSPWTYYLVAGWQAPESWGVWGRDADATILLPPLADASVHELCAAFTIGALPPRRSWRIQIAIDDAIASPSVEYHGGGPFTIRTMASINAGQPIRIDFHGPRPVIPRSFDRHSHDYRNVSFSLFKVVLTKSCG